MCGSQLRQKYISGARRIVVKIGTNVIGDRGGGFREGRIDALSDQIASLAETGRRVAVVSSGAIGAGMSQLGMAKRPRSLPALQAAASVGQSKLVSRYDRSLKKHNLHAGQILLTRDDFDSRQRYLNAANTVNALFESGCVPIINENDTISTEEIQFGDNDLLAAFVTHLIRAELLVLLTSVPGLCGTPPFPDNVTVSESGVGECRFGDRIDVVRKIDDRVNGLALAEKSPDGTGGMESKLKAAEMAVEAGETAVIADGRLEGVLTGLVDGRSIGTLFLPVGEKLDSRKRWIRFTRRARGRVIIDTGAGEALTEKGKSLLPSGVVEVKGDFQKGDTVSVSVKNGRDIARGLSNYSAADMRKIKGCRTDELADILGVEYFDEVIHRDNMALI